jgi:hypothetical protein
MTKIVRLAVSSRADLVIAVRDRDTATLPKLLALHHQDTVRVS